MQEKPHYVVEIMDCAARGSVGFPFSLLHQPTARPGADSTCWLVQTRMNKYSAYGAKDEGSRCSQTFPLADRHLGVFWPLH